jgi:methylenetetrahydrofolate dehydrogenase (NADP+)/methenyltetrahydrofolate cyclohydrolase
MSTLLDGTALAREVRQQLTRRVAALPGTPGLAVLVVAGNAASQVYVRNKIRACEEVGVHSQLFELPAATSELELRHHIERMNAQPEIHGILVQLPLPKHIAAQNAIDAIDPRKDVDGLHSHNLGALLAGHPQILPCTAAGVMALVKASGTEPWGLNAVVVGASNVVGKPTALLLLQSGATVTLCNSKTRDLAAATRQADILVAAVGKANLVTASMVKPGAVVIDVGINRTPDGRLAGDVDYKGVAAIASHITPVPGGVGPMTVAMLVSNTVAAAERAMRLTS